MRNNILLFATFLLICFILGNTQNNTNNINFHLKKRQPIIGMLSIPYPIQDKSGEKHFYLYSSYISYFELVGAKVTVLKYTDSYEVLKKQMELLDGLVLPGGGAHLMVYKNNSDNRNTSKTKSTQFSEFLIKGSFLVDLARKFNDEGRYFPIFGICLGMEMLVISFAQKEVRSKISGLNFFNGLEVIPSNIEHSRLLGNASKELIQYLSKEKLYFNFQNGLKPFTKNSFLNDHFIPLIYSTDKNGQKYIAALEAKNYPFYGLQFHPEKTGKKLKNGEVLTIERMQVSQYFADFFHLQCLEKIESNEEPGGHSKFDKEIDINKLNSHLLFVDQLAPTLNKHKDEIYIFNAQGNKPLNINHNGEDLETQNEEIQEDQNDSSSNINSQREGGRVQEEEEQQNENTYERSELDQQQEESKFPGSEKEPKQLTSNEYPIWNNTAIIGISFSFISVLLILLGRYLLICFKRKNNIQYIEQSDQKPSFQKEQLPPKASLSDSDKIQMHPIGISDSL